MKQWLWMVGAFVLFAALLVVMRPRPSDLAEVAVRSADVQEAVRLLVREQAAHPSDLHLQAQLATAYERADRPGEGLDQLAALARRAALTPEQRAQVRRLAYADARPQRAYAILTGPRQPRGKRELRELVGLAIATHHPDAALTDQAALVALAPHDARELGRLRDLAEQNGHEAEARDAQTALLALDSSPAQAQRLVQIDLALQQPGQALDALVKYAPPHDAHGLKQAYQLAIWAKQPARAVTYLQTLYQLAPTQETGAQLAAQLVASHDAHALSFLAAFTARYPQDVATRDLYLNQLASAGRTPEALALLERLVAAQPAAAEPHRRLVSFALGHSLLDAAIAELTRWTQRAPHDRDALHQLAVAQVWATHAPRAWDTYARLFATGADDIHWREAWAAISQAQDDCMPAGLANLKALVAAEPQNLDYRRRLAAALLEADFPHAALEAQQALVRLPGATDDDSLNLAEWSLWYGHEAAGLALLKRLDRRAPLPVATLDDAVDYAARAHRFADAAWFLTRLTEREPQNISHWEMLAAAEQTLGDLPAATRAFAHRFALDPATASQRSQLLSLLLRQQRDADALSAILGWQRVASVDEWRLGLELAQRLHRPADERRCLAGWIAAAPRSAEALVAKASFEEREGDPAAEADYRAALALAPRDVALLTRMAAASLYGRRPDRAAPYVHRLEQLPGLDAESERVIADFESSRAPARAAAALDALHALGAGDASTHFQRGELALALGQGAIAESEFRRAVALGAKAKDPQSQTAVGYALERLGEVPQARALWQRLAAAEPQSATPWVSLAHLALAAHDLDGAHAALVRAQAIAPQQTDVRAARADWLKASGREAEAADVYASLRLADPGTAYWAAAEAIARVDVGQYGRADRIARRALAAAPGNADLVEAYRQARDKGASQTGFTALVEGYSGLDRRRFGVDGQLRLNDHARLNVAAEQLSWAGGGMQAQQLGVGVAGEAGALDGSAKLQLARQLTLTPGVQAPLGELKAGVHAGASSLHVTLAESRWEDTNALALAGARERSASVEGLYQPDPRLSLRAQAGLGQLRVPGQPNGLATTALGEIGLHPDAASPWGLYYQWSYHGWGTLGVANGLPDHLTSQDLSVGYARRFGPLSLDLQPGLALDSSAQLTPTLNADLACDVATDGALELQVGWSGRSLAVGQAGAYDLVALDGHWWF